MDPRPILTAGVDIGGTKVLAGVVDDKGHILIQVRLRTPHRSKSPAVVEDTIAEAIEQLVAEHDIAAVGVGAAGFIDARGTTVRFSPHLSWRDEPLKASLESRLGLPVVVDNDANTTALAESRFGAGRGYRDLLCVTLGTGIGGALVVDGDVYRGGNGMAGEFGHMQLVPSGHPCECGNRGCWEQYVSGNALVRAARKLVESETLRAHPLHEVVDGDPTRLTGQVVTQAALAGDAAAVELFEEMGAWLGTGLANLTAAFDPEVIVVGGGLSQAGDLLLDPARAALRRTLAGRGFRPEPAIVPARLGVDAGFIGAADLARSSLSLTR